jgi:hypothetical protein
MESIPLKRETVLAIFGTRAGTKLLNFLNTCCQAAPAIQISVTATCAGNDGNGNPTYNITASATYNVSIAGYTTLIGYLSPQPFPDMSSVTDATLNNYSVANATLFVENIIAGKPAVLANLVSGGGGITPGTYYAMVTDTRGNFTTPISFTVPSCS